MRLGNSKHWCGLCDVIVKALPHSEVSCPHCAGKMRDMGKQWKPGPKGNRMKYYPNGYPPPRLPFWVRGGR